MTKEKHYWQWSEPDLDPMLMYDKGRIVGMKEAALIMAGKL